MVKLGRNDECVTIKIRKISRLLFSNELVQLVFLESGLQYLLNYFAAACDIAGRKISTSKTEMLHLLRNPVQCSLQVGGVSLQQVEKFKYLEVALTRDGKQDKELFNEAKQLLYNGALHHLVVLKRELSR